MEAILKRIKHVREQKGYSHEYVAHMLNLSQVAYSKLENNKTKLSVERLYKIAEILETPIEKLLEIKATHVYNQKLNDNSIGHQEIKNLYQENKEQNRRIIALYEERINDKDMIITQLRAGKK